MVKCADCGFISLRDYATRELIEVEDRISQTGIIKFSGLLYPKTIVYCK